MQESIDPQIVAEPPGPFQQEEAASPRTSGFSAREEYHGGDRHIFLRDGRWTDDNAFLIYSLSDDELITLEADLAQNTNFNASKTFETRVYADRVARALCDLHPSALPTSTYTELQRGVGNRVFLVDGETLRDFDNSWDERPAPTHSKPPQSDGPMNGMRLGGMHKPRGDIILIGRYDGSDFAHEPGTVEFARQISGAGEGDDERLAEGLEMIARANTQNAIVEEVTHLAQDAGLPTAAKEVLAKADKRDVLAQISEQTGEMYGTNNDDEACAKLCREIERDLQQAYPDVRDPLGHLSFGTFDASHIGVDGLDYAKLHAMLIERILEGARTIFKPGQYDLDQNLIEQA